MYVSRTFDPQFSESGGFPMAAHHRACSTGSVHACMLRTTPSKQLGATDNHVRASTRSRNGAGVDRHLHECNRRFGPATTCPRHNLQATRLPRSIPISLPSMRLALPFVVFLLAVCCWWWPSVAPPRRFRV